MRHPIRRFAFTQLVLASRERERERERERAFLQNGCLGVPNAHTPRSPPSAPTIFPPIFQSLPHKLPPPTKTRLDNSHLLSINHQLFLILFCIDPNDPFFAPTITLCLGISQDWVWHQCPSDGMFSNCLICLEHLLLHDMSIQDPTVFKPLCAGTMAQF